MWAALEEVDESSSSCICKENDNDNNNNSTMMTQITTSLAFEHAGMVSSNIFNQV